MVDNQLPTNTEINVNSLPKEMPGTPKWTKRIIILAVSFITLIGILAIGFLSLSKNDPTLKIVDGTRIKQSDVDNLAKERLSTSIPPEQKESIEKNLLNDLVTEKIIQNEAKRRNIEVTEQEVNERLTSYTVKSDAIKNLIYNELLREKVKSAVVSWKVINYLYVYKEPILENYNDLASKVKQSMENVKAIYNTSKSLKTAYNQAYNDPSFDKLIALNENAKVYYDSFDKSISSKLFTYDKGQLTDVIDSGAGTFILAEILEINNVPYKTFDEWINAMIKKQ